MSNCVNVFAPPPIRMDDFYFLTEPEDFIGSHFPDEQCWQLLDVPLALEEFERSVFRTSRFYTLGLSLPHPRHALILTGERALQTLGYPAVFPVLCSPS